MKVEMGTPNQIRCFLTKADLELRNIDVNNFVYGSTAFNVLVKEILNYASHKFNFHTGGNPIMTEAIPMMDNSMILLISKMEEADELDGRFSDFTLASDDVPMNSDQNIPADHLFGPSTRKPIHSNPAAEAVFSSKSALDANYEETQAMESILFHFNTIEDIIRLSRELGAEFEAVNHLYRDGQAGFSLMIEPWSCKPQDYSKFCEYLTDFGNRIPISGYGIISYQEHNQLLIRSCAIQSLSRIEDSEY